MSKRYRSIDGKENGWSVLDNQTGVFMCNHDIATLLNERDELEAAINRSPFVLSPCQLCGKPCIGLDGEPPWCTLCHDKESEPQA